MLKGSCALHFVNIFHLDCFADKSAGGRVSQHFEEAAQKLQDYSECLVIEVNERITILDMLKECKIFATYRLAELQRVITVKCCYL